MPFRLQPPSRLFSTRFSKRIGRSHRPDILTTCRLVEIGRTFVEALVERIRARNAGALDRGRIVDCFRELIVGQNREAMSEPALER